ncbi:alpha-L-fucosidase-like [Haliotis rufescens]|uniref:alpha-L-fucosidase-like n=1 Tax=Haliotis rufescens TaxID=6454 RepID=UPI00201F5D5C|nr:alpha-L-fucosidase-like [Haliotis rufescens]
MASSTTERCLLWILFLLVCYSTFSPCASKRYEPNWDSLDTRPLPSWYDEAKLGIFIHWGVFSVPSYSSEWFWWNWKGQPLPAISFFMQENYPPDFTYADFAREFTAEFYNPEEWASIFEEAGAKYVVFVSKHHEGFCNWPCKTSFNWNSKAVGPNRDLVGELASAIKSKTSMKFGVYHTLFEWFNPLFLQDKANNFTTQSFVFNRSLPELYELVNSYEPEVVWSDASGGGSAEYWQAQEFIAWLYNDSPVKDTVVTNDRWGSGTDCHHGGFYTCDDRYNPGVLQKHKWENAMTIDHYSWGYRRNAKLTDYLTIEDLLETFVETVSCGGNLLMNIGPTKDGRLIPIFQERLKQMGDWMKVNGEAIYSTRPWTHQNDTVTKRVWYTSKKDGDQNNVYAIILDWPEGDTLTLGAPVTTVATTVSLMGYQGNFNWKKGNTGGIVIEIPPIPVNKIPCMWAWSFKLTGLSN